ncbi:carbonic anhydrase [Microbacterium rhizomatis]|uniref:Carbonic anhydrase n=1 Tax=Microbacterium rhizomatis TaxID=1631477 RepID=A0A5J5J215_9MICO|nr:carbonic anhydrase [Microbacterium rhizomatis]KAA9110136.1 carbonic anhydrase [Microbacterium rhizomatis]
MSLDRPTPGTAWADMQSGNVRFVDGTPEHPRQDIERRHSIAAAQKPRAALFGCSDSRLSAEIIFDMGLGDLFVVRNAGQVISDSVVGSLEYAVAVLEVPLIVVLGHDECGAVNAAIDSTRVDAPSLPPHIWRQIAPIVPAVRRVIRETAVDGVPTGDIDGERVGREHLRDTVAELLHSSELISDAIAEGRLAIVGANYRLGEGTAVPDIIVGDANDAGAGTGGTNT